MPTRSNAHQHQQTVTQCDTGTTRQHAPARISPSKTTSHTSHRSDYKQRTYPKGTAGIQLLLFITILSAAYVYNPKLDISFLVACGAALTLLLILRVWVSRHDGWQKTSYYCLTADFWTYGCLL